MDTFAAMKLGLKAIVPYRTLVLTTSDGPELVTRRLSQIRADRFSCLLGRIGARGFKLRRNIGWNRRPGLPVAIGDILASDGGGTEVRVVIRLTWPAYMFASVWLCIATLMATISVLQAMRHGNWLPAFGMAGLVTGFALLILPTFHRESAWLESVVRNCVVTGGRNPGGGT
jgi:hypothetical protein